MNLPEKFKFNLELAELGWPLIHDDCPFVMFEPNCRGFGEHKIGGIIRRKNQDSPAICREDELFLSADLTNADVREAVEQCYAEGFKVLQWNEQSKTWLPCAIPLWRWDETSYLPAILMPEVRTKPEYRKVEHGLEGFEKVHSEAWWNAVFYYADGKYIKSVNCGKWNNPQCDLYTRLTREELAALDGPKVIAWAWGDEGLPLTSAGKYQGKPCRIDAFPDGVLVDSGVNQMNDALTYAEAKEQVTVNGKPFAKNQEGVK